MDDAIILEQKNDFKVYVKKIWKILYRLWSLFSAKEIILFLIKCFGHGQINGKNAQMLEGPTLKKKLRNPFWFVLRMLFKYGSWSFWSPHIIKLSLLLLTTVHESCCLGTRTYWIHHQPSRFFSTTLTTVPFSRAISSELEGE